MTSALASKRILVTGGSGFLDTTKAKDEFDFVAKTDFKDGLKRTIGWYKKAHETR